MNTQVRCVSDAQSAIHGHASLHQWLPQFLKLYLHGIQLTGEELSVHVQRVCAKHSGATTAAVATAGQG